MKILASVVLLLLLMLAPSSVQAATPVVKFSGDHGRYAYSFTIPSGRYDLQTHYASHRIPECHVVLNFNYGKFIVDLRLNSGYDWGIGQYLNEGGKQHLAVRGNCNWKFTLTRI